MTAVMQTTLLDGWVREHPRVRLRPDCWGDPWRIARTEAERHVRDLGQLPGTNHWSLRLLPVRAKGEHTEYGFTASSGAYEVWTEARGLYKYLNADGTIVDMLQIYPKKAGKYSAENYIKEEIADLAIDGDDLVVTTASGREYAATIVDDEDPDTFRRCDIRDRERYNPSEDTEHFILAAIRAGIPREEITALHLQAYAPTVAAPPFILDFDGHGGQKVIQNPKCIAVCDIAERIGITLPYVYDVPKPEPPVDIAPVYRCKHCAHTKGCQRKKEAGGGIGCPTYTWDRLPVPDAHVYNPAKKNTKKRTPRTEEDE